jgi:hypothetical protein
MRKVPVEIHTASVVSGIRLVSVGVVQGKDGQWVADEAGIQTGRSVSFEDGHRGAFIAMGAADQQRRGIRRAMGTGTAKREVRAQDQVTTFVGTAYDFSHGCPGIAMQ